MIQGGPKNDRELILVHPVDDFAEEETCCLLDFCFSIRKDRESEFVSWIRIGTSMQGLSYKSNVFFKISVVLLKLASTSNNEKAGINF